LIGIILGEQQQAVSHAARFEFDNNKVTMMTEGIKRSRVSTALRTIDHNRRQEF